MNTDSACAGCETISPYGADHTCSKSTDPQGLVKTAWDTLRAVLGDASFRRLPEAQRVNLLQVHHRLRRHLEIKVND